MSLRGRRAVAALLVGCSAVLAGCAPGSAPLARTASLASLRSAPPLLVAERSARDVGSVPPASVLQATVTLRDRDPSGLATMLAAGGRVSASQFAARYGPDPATVSAVLSALTASRLHATWTPGDVSLAVSGAAAAMERFFGITVHDFVAADGTRFYGPLGPLVTPRVIAAAVTAVTGMTDYHVQPIAAVPDVHGVSPSAVMSFYNITPLRTAHLDGTGMTVMFPEWAMPDESVLDAYATEFKLAPFHVQTRTDASWGQPADPTGESAGEAALDLEIVHGIAPGAQEIVYVLGDQTKLPAVLTTMTSEHPGAIVSSSIGRSGCEAEPGQQSIATAMDAVFTAAAARGTSIFWATGDRGAYACLADNNPQLNGTLSLDGDGSGGDGVTAVGGTSVLFGSDGSYFEEAAWGNPIHQWGGGGGYSQFFSRPAWQVAPGFNNPMRGVPDVSADADTVTGWDIISPSTNGPTENLYGGTSAATPCWAAIAALIDEDLTQQGLRTIGFANPALYDFAQNPSGLPAPPFHTITLGNNLHYQATAGWNAATGLGSPDVGALADDFEWYERSHASG